jgi:hypothetical protein
MKMEVIRFFEASVRIQTTFRYIPEDGNIKNTFCVMKYTYTHTDACKIEYEWQR